MDVPFTTWSLSELETEGSFFENQHQMVTDPFVESMASFSSGSLTYNHHYLFPIKPSFQAATSGERAKGISSNQTGDPFSCEPSNTFIMSFGNPNALPETHPHQLYNGCNQEYMALLNPIEEAKTKKKSGSVEGSKRVPRTSRSPAHVQDNILAERKRRETLNQRLIALSSLLPNLKKMDKASVLEDATKYIEQLQTRMEELKEETTSNSKIYYQESAVTTIRKSKILDGASDDMASSSSSNEDTFIPEIEVRISDNSVLVKILSKRKPSLVTKTLSEMERLQLTINGSNIIPFSSNIVLLTISAQMSWEFIMTATELVKRLQSTIRNS